MSSLSLSSEIATRRREKLDTRAIADVLEPRTNATTKEAGAMIKYKVGTDEYEDVAGRANDTRGAELDLAHARRQPIVWVPDKLVALLAQVALEQKE